MFISIRTKLILMSFTAVLVSATAIIVSALHEHERIYKETISQDLLAFSDNLANEMIEYFSITPADEFGISTKLLQLDNYPYIRYAAVLDANNQIIQPYVNPTFFYDGILNEIQKLTLSNHVDIQLDEQVIIETNDLIIKRPIGDDYAVGSLIISVDYQNQIDASQKAFMAKLLPFAILVILAVLILAHWLQSNIIKPLIRLTTLVYQVKQTANYKLKSTTQGNDEVSTLANGINAMLDTINQEKEANIRHTQTLVSQQNALYQLANFDVLTHLPNRQLFIQKITDKLNESNNLFAILILDLDDFKTINDTLGHANGDLFLIEVAKRLKSNLDEEGLLARIGGDEFAMIIPNLKHENDVHFVIHKIFTALTPTFCIHEWQININVSVGIAFNHTAQNSQPILLSHADIAMYKAKTNGKNQYVIFKPDMQEQQERRLQIAGALTQAIENNEFYLLYQVKVSPNTGVRGMEALLRWQSPSLGFISPSEFIPIAEQSGKITDLTRWIIHQGFEQLSTVLKASTQNLIVSFNLSAYDILKPSFLIYLKQQFKHFKLNPNNIEFEITESIYMENFTLANLFIKEIKQFGCHISLDDFGTGYSSLSYLTQIQANTLKIDQQFIFNLLKSEMNQQIVEAIISLAKKLNLEICAEGVETQAQYQFLHQAGCDLIQGYLFSKPLIPEKIPAKIIEINHKLSINKDKVS